MLASCGFVYHTKETVGESDREHLSCDFKNALGFTVDDADEAMRQVYRWVGKYEPTYKYTDEHGERFETLMDMNGKSKTAKVIAV